LVRARSTKALARQLVSQTSPRASSKVTDEWVEGRRYMRLEVLAKARLRVLPGDTPTQNQLPQTLTA
jgi:hypothetical protein